MPQHYFTILGCDDWMIYTWDPLQQRVLSYDAELWHQWLDHQDYLTYDGRHDVSVMAHFLDCYPPEVLDDAESASILKMSWVPLP
jgi:hypothetical protein